jgi:hypothetical protein
VRLAARSFAVHVLLGLAMAVFASVPAARAAQGQPLPTAREVIDRHAAVCKLREALASTRSMHTRGKVTIAARGIEGTVETWSAKPALNRSSIELGAAGSVLGGYDGRVGWMLHSALGASVFQGTDLLQSELEADWDAALKEGDAYESLRTVGRESFEGRECWKIEVVARPLPGMDAEATREARTAHEYYEIETGFLAGTKSRLEGELGSVLTTTVVSDYREFGGRLLATRTRVRQAGQESVVTLESVEFDTVDPGLFRLPPEIQRLLAAKPAPLTPR